MKIYDTTLRDGTQSPDLNLSVREKIEFTLALDKLGVDYIELGWPGSNTKDMEAFNEISKYKLDHAKICAFGATRKKGVRAEEDPNLNAILKSKASVATLFGKTWLVHVEKQLGMKPEENLDIIYESVKFLKDKNLEVVYDAEHFFDGFKDNKDYALQCLSKAYEAGADCLVLCDTNGGCFPWEIKNIVNEVKEYLRKNDLKIKIGIHCHNDRDLAVPNSLLVVKDVDQIQGTINGFGERTGNTDLCSIMPALVNMQINFNAEKNLKKLTALSRLLFTLGNIRPYTRQPYVGKNAFSHKGGIHVDAVSKGASYEFMNPEDVGNQRETILSDLSGKANIVEMVKKFGYEIDKNDKRIAKMLIKVKGMEKEGYDINGVEAEQYLLTKQFFNNAGEFIKIEFFDVRSIGRKSTRSTCFMKAAIENEMIEYESKVSGGPVDALYCALQNMLKKVYPDINKLKLENYKVRIAEQKGVSSSVRVYVEFSFNKNRNKQEWATVGVNDNILTASLEAVKKGFEYYFMKIEKKTGAIHD
ncbi:MAG: citramalate synthase [Acidobacteria bacterium]|nr:citramalate synthase [Acidobacteriota bacterium]|tara:strand:+ start:31091 stop:32680 length:1590 start_codon:yes stop_codon:yes gene_type:complete